MMGTKSTKRTVAFCAGLLLALAPALFTANDFSGDPNCKALWSFENGALTTDSIGSNTLTNTGVAADTVNYKEKLASGDWERDESDKMTITDASLDAGFPLKNGDTNKKISVACWFKLEAAVNAAIHPLFAKEAALKYSFKVYVYGQAANQFKPYFAIGTSSGSSWESKVMNQLLDAANWYHVAVTFQDSDKSWHVRLYDLTNTTQYDWTGTATNNINVEDAGVTIGNSSIGERYDGLIDEMVIFNDILTSDEIDQIRDGSLGAAASGQVMMMD